MTKGRELVEREVREFVAGKVMADIWFDSDGRASRCAFTDGTALVIETKKYGGSERTGEWTDTRFWAEGEDA